MVQKSRLGKIIWSQCIVQGCQELFGEGTVDDVTVKDSRVENDQPKMSKPFLDDWRPSQKLFIYASNHSIPNIRGESAEMSVESFEMHPSPPIHIRSQKLRENVTMFDKTETIISAHVIPQHLFECVFEAFRKQSLYHPFPRLGHFRTFFNPFFE
ncbi:hypothetical protein BLNAU_4882 [Blattamonas nauphoetae]|uniref:Uncharacterized protein n=1 Tax=Blattamonas nauphoetae TaxID=2049346 RepID=A0ABQ9Y8H7_9EUKA|nr:hypothetical protein BLNAU_4882 [Blattamonas nauphoetae]